QPHAREVGTVARLGQAGRAGSLGLISGADAELTHSRQVVLDAERRGQLPVLDMKDVDLIDVLEAPVGGGHPEPLAAMGPGAPEMCDDRVALGDQLDDLHLEVGEGAPKWADPPLGRQGELTGGDLVDDSWVVLGERLLEQPADQALVVLSRHGPGRRSTPRAGGAGGRPRRSSRDSATLRTRPGSPATRRR